MKRNLLPALFLVAACNTYAMSIEGGKLVSHSESVAPHSTLSFKQSNVNPNVKTFLKSKINVKAPSRYSEIIQVMNTLGDIKLTVVQGNSVYADISGNNGNEVMIHNNTAEPKLYKVVHEICTSPMDVPATTCSTATNTVSVDPNSTAFDAIVPELRTSFYTPGLYAVSIWTAVENVNDTILMDAYDYRQITVPDPFNKK